MRPGCRRVCLDQLRRGALRGFDKHGVALQIGEAQQRQTALALAEVFPGPAQLEVATCDLEPVGALVETLVARAARR